MVMEKTCYQEIIDELSKKLTGKFTSEEKDLARRATSIDGDIAEIVKEVGQKTCRLVLEEIRDQLVVKKKRK